VARKGEVWTGVGATAGWLKQLKDAGEDIERFGVQPMRRPEAKNRLERALLTTETNDRNETGEYPRRNARRRFLRFGETGWWRRNCQLPTQSSNLTLTPEPGTEIFDAETGGRNGPIPAIAGAETAPTREFGRRPFSSS
jgi:hypothetical protein